MTFEEALEYLAKAEEPLTEGAYNHYAAVAAFALENFKENQANEEKINDHSKKPQIKLSYLIAAASESVTAAMVILSSRALVDLLGPLRVIKIYQAHVLNVHFKDFVTADPRKVCENAFLPVMYMVEKSQYPSGREEEKRIVKRTIQDSTELTKVLTAIHRMGSDPSKNEDINNLFNARKNPYEILEIDNFSSIDVIKKAANKKVIADAPDKHLYTVNLHVNYRKKYEYDLMAKRVLTDPNLKREIDSLIQRGYFSPIVNLPVVAKVKASSPAASFPQVSAATDVKQHAPIPKATPPAAPDEKSSKAIDINKLFSKETKLIQLCAEGNVNAVKDYFKTMPASEKTPENFLAAFLVVCQVGNVEVILFLLLNGNNELIKEYYPLWMASESEKHGDLINQKVKNIRMGESSSEDIHILDILDMFARAHVKKPLLDAASLEEYLKRIPDFNKTHQLCQAVQSLFPEEYPLLEKALRDVIVTFDAKNVDLEAIKKPSPKVELLDAKKSQIKFDASKLTHPFVKDCVQGELELVKQKFEREDIQNNPDRSSLLLTAFSAAYFFNQLTIVKFLLLNAWNDVKTLGLLDFPSRSNIFDQIQSEISPAPRVDSALAQRATHFDDVFFKIVTNNEEFLQRYVKEINHFSDLHDLCTIVSRNLPDRYYLLEACIQNAKMNVEPQVVANADAKAAAEQSASSPQQGRAMFWGGQDPQAGMREVRGARHEPTPPTSGNSPSAGKK